MGRIVPQKKQINGSSVMLQMLESLYFKGLNVRYRRQNIHLHTVDDYPIAWRKIINFQR